MGRLVLTGWATIRLTCGDRSASGAPCAICVGLRPTRSPKRRASQSEARRPGPAVMEPLPLLRRPGFFLRRFISSGQRAARAIGCDCANLLM